MSKIRYGIIGCGSMGREHIENLRAMGGAEVTAIADPTLASREQAATLLDGQVRLFEHHTDLLDSGLCDAVVIASPNFTHIAVMRDALATDLHILVEKPLVTKIADGIELIELAKAKKRGIVWVAQEYRYMPPVAEMIRIAHDGGVGRLHQVAIREHREPFYPKVGDWNRFNANTGGTLVEKCCHYFNLMDFILQEKPLRVFASGGQRVNHLDEKVNGKTPDILDSAYVIVEYPSGARASLDLCMFAENSVDNEHVVIVGDEGKLESLLPSGIMRYGRREDWGRREAWGQPSGTGRGVAVRQVRDTNIKYPGQHFGASYVEHLKFAQAVRQGTAPEIPLEEGLRAVATGLAAHKSIDEGRVVALTEVLPAGW
jgi:myo-inositol 2-dehydrogenase/D-chiro-inositol 1-dehydrogenase